MLCNPPPLKPPRPRPHDVSDFIKVIPFVTDALSVLDLRGLSCFDSLKTKKHTMKGKNNSQLPLRLFLSFATLLPLPQSENLFLFLWLTAFISLTCPPLASLHSLCRSLIQLESNLNSSFYKHKQTDLIIMKSYSVPQSKSSKETHTCLLSVFTLLTNFCVWPGGWGVRGHQHSNLHHCFFLTAEWEFTLSKPEKWCRWSQLLIFLMRPDSVGGAVRSLNTYTFIFCGPQSCNDIYDFWNILS